VFFFDFLLSSASISFTILNFYSINALNSMSLTGDENRNCEIFVDFKRSFNNASKLSSSSKIVTFPYGVGESKDVLLFVSLN
jgi:hypothetical protein